MTRKIPKYDDYPQIGRVRLDPSLALANSDPLLIRRGLVTGASLVHKFGRNSGVPNGTWEGVLQAAAQFYWPQVATTVRIKVGGNAADDAAASPLGAGAWEVTVQGIDGVTGLEVSEAIATAGASASIATTATFLRVYRAWVSSAGTYTGNNTAAIVIEDGAGANDMITILAGEGQSQFCSWTVPAGKTAMLTSVMVQADAAKAADFRLFTRENANDVTVPFSPKRLRYFWDGVLGNSMLKPVTPILSASAFTDIWIEARGGGAGTEVSADMELIVYDD